MEHACYSCGKVLPEITAEDFFSKESKERPYSEGARGVRFVADAFAAEIRGDDTEHWECEICWWQGWWDI